MVLLSSIKNIFVKIKNFISPPKYTRYSKNVEIQNSLFERNLQIPWWPFLNRSYIFFLKRKCYQKWKILFFTQSMRDTKKISRSKIVRWKNIYRLVSDYFFIIVIYFYLFIKTFIMKIKNSIFPPKYTRYGKNVRKQNCLFQKDLQLCSGTNFLKASKLGSVMIRKNKNSDKWLFTNIKIN